TTAKRIRGRRTQPRSKPAPSRRLRPTRPTLYWTCFPLSVQPQWTRGSCSSQRAPSHASCGGIRTEDGHLPPLACSSASPPLRPRPPGRPAPTPRRGGRVPLFLGEDLDARALAFHGPGWSCRAGGLARARVRARHGGPAVLPLDAHHRRSVRRRRALAPDRAPHQAARRQRGTGGPADQYLGRVLQANLPELRHHAGRRVEPLRPCAERPDGERSGQSRSDVEVPVLHEPAARDDCLHRLRLGGGGNGSEARRGRVLPRLPAPPPLSQTHAVPSRNALVAPARP